MTRVCLVGDGDVNLRYELLSRETAREALATYDLREPFENTLAVETVSLGAAVALLNDLDWYIVRFVDEALVLEPSVSDAEWLSRDLATAIRDEDVAPGETDRFLKVYGVEYPSEGDPESASESTSEETQTGGHTPGASEPETGPDDGDETAGAARDRPPRLVEPMLVVRTGGTIPDYDIRDVEETLVVRVTESEFGG